MKRSRIQVWLYEQINMRIEGCIIGFDEYMNLVLDDAEEVHMKTKTRKPLVLSTGSRHLRSAFRGVLIIIYYYRIVTYRILQQIRAFNRLERNFIAAAAAARGTFISAEEVRLESARSEQEWAPSPPCERKRLVLRGTVAMPTWAGSGTGGRAPRNTGLLLSREGSRGARAAARADTRHPGSVEVRSGLQISSDKQQEAMFVSIRFTTQSMISESTSLLPPQAAERGKAKGQNTVMFTSAPPQGTQRWKA
ncbi:hypothetical protein Z043_111519 [Scleropages formosus]|uniref:Small nuclear ribonucleoprotein E n=1 Tax=Scleropages formosus TaxID=113540 RepID=A0A0P7X694_SCLFO|nr:hypothetical protein Z043_111519 [Scleropages formosus]